MTKAELRKLMLKKRSEMSGMEVEQKSALILKNFLASDLFSRCSTVMLYASYGNEVSTTGFLDAVLSSGKNAVYPRVDGKNMDFYIVKSADELEPGFRGIPEPVASCKQYIPEDETSLMLLPGCCFDEAGHRIGYGGGFYDRYLNRFPFITKGSLAYDLEIVGEIASDPWDIPVSYIFTETRLIKSHQNQ